MHACLSHIYNHVFTLFILFVIYPKKSVMIMCEQRYLNKDRSSASPRARTRTSGDRARAATRRTRQEPWWLVQATSTQAQATRSQAQAVKMKMSGGARARRVQAGTSVD
jgi:hypothetical protein